MVLSIKFTSNKIYISEQSSGQHTVKVYKTFMIDMPEGAYQKGVIIDTVTVAAKIAETLKEGNVRTKEVISVILGTDILQKEMQLPYASMKETRGMVESELRRIDLLKNEYLFDFITENDKKGKNQGETRTTSVSLIPKTLVHNYMQTLQKAGLKPVKIKPFYDTMDKLIRILEIDKKDDITILAYVEQKDAEICITGRNMKNVYRSIQIEDEEHIEENMYILSTKQSIQKNNSSEQVMLEKLAEGISRLVQFQLQRNRDLQVKEILLYGELAQGDEFIANLADSTGMNVRRCELPSTVLKIGSKADLKSNLDMVAIDLSRRVGENKELCFVKQYNEQKSGFITKKDLIPVYIMSVILLVVLIAGIIAGVFDYQYRKKTADCEKQIESMITSKQYNDNLIKQEMLQSYVEYNRICGQYIEVLENTGRLESKLLNDLDGMKQGKVTIDSYNFENNVLVLSCHTPDQNAPAGYAERVTNSGIFKSVEYAGFQEESDVEGISYYHFSLKCALQ